MAQSGPEKLQLSEKSKSDITSSPQSESKLPYSSSSKSYSNYEELFDSGYNSNVQSKTYLESETDIINSATMINNDDDDDSHKHSESSKTRLDSSAVLLDSGVGISESSIEINTDSSSSLFSSETKIIEQQTTLLDKLVSSTLFALCQKRNEEGDTLLHLAIIENRADVACSIIMNSMIGIEFLDSYNYLYQTPLHLAVLKQQRKVIECLVSRGASICFQDNQGNTPFHIACKYSLADIVQFFLVTSYKSLLASNLFEVLNYDGDTCFHLAARNNNLTILELLFQTGASIDLQEGKSGKTILHFAVENLNVPLVHFLVKKCKANTFAKSFAEQTPVYLAYKMQSLITNEDPQARPKIAKIIKILIENFENMFNPCSSSSSEADFSDEDDDEDDDDDENNRN